LPHSPGWDEENLQPQGDENDEPNPPIEGAPNSHVGSRTCWVQENEKADHHAKEALQGDTNKNYKTVVEDWKKWISEKSEGIRQAEWTSSDNPMVTVMRGDQGLISWLRMDHTRLTQGYRVDLYPSPECGDYGVRLTVDHLLLDCTTFRRQRIEYNISRETLSGDDDENRRQIRYVQKIGVYHEIWDEFKRDHEHQKTKMANEWKSGWNGNKENTGWYDDERTRQMDTQSMKRKTKWNVNDRKCMAMWRALNTYVGI
jgi:hypothetical protein